MSGYVHGDLLTSRARGWWQAKEEIVPFFFSCTSCSFSRLHAHALSNGREKKNKTKERNKDRKEKNNFC